MKPIPDKSSRFTARRRNPANRDPKPIKKDDREIKNMKHSVLLTSMADGPGWWRRQIDTALPVTGKRIAFRSDQLIDTDVRNPRTQGLGSMHDIVMNPKTGKIAYLVIARAGIFGFDTKYVPIPWDDFKATRSVNLLVLDATSARMDAAPEVSDDQFPPIGHFDQESQKMDAYWKTHLASGKSGG
jgi:sporulation protein YlmC with PRC-barrel domain